ncbi:branched-chain amino acid ABC transporter permease [Brenneria tiliae]|uniref:Branched-chain amino acid ABC transporter permease n=1 Tax=Brenneria tiliae TaxID=2914984 RepID=A0ABT0MYX8_9GAMM|nr:branched-chain amino acid ABC transporter permease [Brenneria tiliae]MCL2895065.1 branched-chain amino acid ABC transporter permease [Brenneria tiliae]
MDFINFYLIPGIVQGSIYALGAIGITLVYSIMRHGHFAHGDLSTFGAFLALFFTTTLALPLYAALLLAIVFTGLIGVGLDRLFYANLRNRPKIITTIASFGVALMLRSVVQVVWGVNTENYVQGISRPSNWFGIRIKEDEIITVAIVLGIVFILNFFLTRSKWGKAMRAMSDNPDLALLSGIDNKKVITLTWMIVGGLCAASGFLLGLNSEVKSMMGWNMLLPMFSAAILGGVGRISGAVVGGFIVGIAEEISVLFLPAEYKMVSAIAILLLVLLIRPTGIFRGKVL